MNPTETMTLVNASWNNAKNRMGKGWELMSEEMREALVAREVVRFIISMGQQQGWYSAAYFAHETMTYNHEALSAMAVLGKREQL